MTSLGLRVISNITKEYPDMIKVVIYKQPKVFIKSDAVKRNREEVSAEYTPSVSSLQRTKSLVRDLVLCNDFDLFCTFTFDPKKVDSFSYGACYQKISTWIHHQRNISREKGIELKYLLIPERHKSGRWHFHGLLSGYTSTLKDSGLVSASLRPILNITSFRSGFTTAVEIDDRDSVSNYVTKYITKDFIKMFNQRRFFASRNLIRPRKELNSREFILTPPIFRRKVAETQETEEYILDKYDWSCKNGSTANVVQYRDCDKRRLLT